MTVKELLNTFNMDTSVIFTKPIYVIRIFNRSGIIKENFSISYNDEIEKYSGYIVVNRNGVFELRYNKIKKLDYEDFLDEYLPECNVAFLYGINGELDKLLNILRMDLVIKTDPNIFNYNCVYYKDKKRKKYQRVFFKDQIIIPNCIVKGSKFYVIKTIKLFVSNDTMFGMMFWYPTKKVPKFPEFDKEIKFAMSMLEDRTRNVYAVVNELDGKLVLEVKLNENG